MTRAGPPASLHREGLPGPRPTLTLVFDRTFGPWFWGCLASNSGNWLYNVTAAVVVFNLTGSAFVVGLVSVMQFATPALLSPWAGALSDRWDRRRLLLVSQSFATVSAAAIAVAVLVLGLEGLPGVWPVLAATFGMGFGLAFAKPAQQSLVPALVDDADLETAVSLTAVTFTLARALGPAVAGVLLVTVGAEAAFAINAVSFLALIAALLVIRPSPRPATGTDIDYSVFAGFRHARQDQAILGLLAGVAAVGFAMDPFITLAPPLAVAFGGGDALTAAMVSTSGLAAAFASFFSGRIQRRWGSLRVARAGLALMALGLGIAAAAPLPAVALGGFAISGMGSMFGLTGFTSLLHRRIPDHLRGRVMALWSLAFLGTRPIAALVDGAAADAVGPRLAMAFAVMVALLGVGFSKQIKVSRR